jgi:DNA-binding NtrC family response regulator
LTLAIHLRHRIGTSLPSVLIIDPDVTAARALARGLQSAARRSQSDALDVAMHRDFSRARAGLRARPPALLVTALRLREYNGLQLVYFVAAVGLPTRSLVYTDTADPVQAREVQAAGAFYEVRSRLPVTLPAYVWARLPPRDRRDRIENDRRRFARGGRRAADQHVAV